MGIITVKKKITKILCWCLSVVTLLTSVPITSYADIDANAGGGGASGSWTGGSGAVTMSASQIGIRFTIVDGKTGETKSLVNGKPGSLDVLYSEPSGVVKYMKTSWFQPIEAEAEIRKENIKDVMNWIKADAGDSVPNLVPWVMSSNGAVQTYGTEIKKWMMTGDSIPYTIGSNSSSNSSHSGNSSNSSSGSSGGASSGSSGGSSGSSTTTSKQVSSSSMKSTLIGTINNGFKSQESNWTQLYTKAVTNTDKKALAQRINNYNASLKSTMYYYREDLSSTDYAYLLRLIDSKTASAKSKYGVTGLASAITDGLKGLFGPITAYASQTTASSNPALPTTGTVTPEKKNSDGYGCNLINVRNDYEYILNLDGTKFVKNSDGTLNLNESITPLDIMAQNGYKLIAEPIIFGRPAHYTTKYTCKYSIYGTGANWIRYSETGFKGDPSYSESGGSYMRLTNMAMPNGMTVENPDTELGVKTPTSLKSKMSWAEQRAALGDKQGLSLHIYSINGDNAAIPTWDSITYPIDNYKPGPAPSGDTYPDETSYGKNSKTFKIMKYYEVSWDDGQTYIPLDYFGRTNTPHTVSIMDEPDFTVTEWFTSKNESSFITDGKDVDSAVYKDQKNKYADGQYSGVGEGKVIVSPSDPEKVLHVLLRQKQLKEGLTVIKVYESNGIVDNVITDYTPVITPENTYEIEDPSLDYDWVEGKTSTNDPKPVDDWTDSEGKIIESDVVPITDDLRVIYLRYSKENDVDINPYLLLHENELSHNFELKDVDGNLHETIRRYQYVDVPNCPYFYDCGCSSDDDDCDCWSCSNDMDEADPGHYSFDIRNTYNYNKRFVYAWKQTDPGHYSGEGGGHKGFDITSIPNMEFTLNRNIDDIPTLYPNMNSDLKSTLTDMGYTKEGYKPSKTRYGGKTDQNTRVIWNQDFKTNWVYQDVGDPTITFECDDDHRKETVPRHQNSSDGGTRYDGSTNSSSKYSVGQIKKYTRYWKVWSGRKWKYFYKKNYSDYKERAQEYADSLLGSDNGNYDGIGSLNSAYSQDNNTTIYGFWGKANQGLEVPVNTAKHFQIKSTGDKNRMSSTFLDTSKKMTYYPYYKMVVQTLSQKTDKDVYLTSENLSTFLNVSRVDISVAQEKGGIPLLLSSYQWSIHARAQNLLNMHGVNDRDSLLPSGAIYQLKVQDNEGVWVKARTYQTCMADNEIERLASKDGIKTQSQAKTTATNFREQVKKILDNYEIVLKAVAGITTDMEDIVDDGVQVTGQAKVTKFDGRSISNESKYLLEANPGSADSSDLDIIGEQNIEIVWKISSDADGNVTVYKNNNKVDSIKKTQSISSLLSNNEIKELDERTKAVTNFVKAIDRNLGSNRNGSTWYNEGFSILVYENDFAFKVGFGSANPIRSSALNINLNGLLDNRDDMFNAEPDTIEDKARTFQFRTSLKSVLTETHSKPAGYIGSFEGMDVIIPNIDGLFTSKLFYTSNTTVQDNN